MTRGDTDEVRKSSLVPTLDLTDLAKGTKVIFEGKSGFGHEAWSGPLVSAFGTDIAVTGVIGATGYYFDGQ